MAEVTGLRNNALNYPVYGAPYGLIIPILDNDGDLVTGAAGLDSEISKNGDTPADCTNEATEIGSSGQYVLLLTAAELTTDVAAGVTKTSTSDAKTTPWCLYPKKLPALRSGTSQAGAAGTITLDSGASALDDAYNGCLIVATLDGAVEARIITDYVGSTKVASVTPNWNTTPDSDDTFIIYLPDGVQVNQANVTAFGTVAGTFAAGIPETKVASIANDAITAAAIATGAIDADAIAANAIGSSEIADGAITANKLAANAITAAKLDPDVTTELQAGLATSAEVADVEGKVDDLESRLGTPSDLGSGATVAANLADIEGFVDNLPSDPADASDVAAAFSALSAKVDAVDDILDTEFPALTAAVQGLMLASGAIGATGNDSTHLHLAGLAYADDAINSMLLTIKDVSTGLFYSRWIEDFANTGDLATVATLPFTPEASVDLYWILPVRADVTGGSGLDAAGVRAAVGLASANLDTQLGAIDDFLDTEVAAIKAKTDNLPSDPADASDIASSFTTVNSKLDTIDDFLDTEVAAIKAKTDNLPADPADASDIASSFTAVNSKLDAIDDFVDTEVAAIKAKTDNLPSDPADASDIAAAFTALTAKVDAIDDFLDTEIAAILAAVDTEVGAIKTVTDQLTAAQAEPSAVPAANATPLAKLAWLAALARNKVTQTATTQTLKADDGTTTIAAATVSDDGTTFTRGEFA